MGLTMKEKRSVAAVTAPSYKAASKKKKGVILRQFIELTGYSWRYGSRLLRQQGKSVRSGKLRIMGDLRKGTKRRRQAVYDEQVVAALKKLWFIMDCICGKRLRAALPELIQALKRKFEIRLCEQTEEKLLKISAATIDRLLAGERKKQALKGRSGTKPGTLLKHQIAVRTFSEWNENRPGFMEVDLVGHDGGDGHGDFCQTLDVTDVCTGWTETRAVRNKAQVWVFEALREVRSLLPFQMLGIDSDNGSEFINYHLYEYCKSEQITFTRSRPSRKNDNCFVEEKNYSIVRRNVGYRRYDTPAELDTLNELYRYLRLYTNFFLPTMKLVSKERIGSKVKKIYDQPRTPYARVLASADVTERYKKRLRQIYHNLNPSELKRNITSQQEKLVKLNVSKERRTTVQPARRSSLKVQAAEHQSNKKPVNCSKSN
jgi:hypothetical protein